MLDRKINIHIHSDNSIFSGSENMIIELINSKEFISNYHFTLSLNSNLTYKKAALPKIKRNIDIYSIKLFQTYYSYNESRIIDFFNKITNIVNDYIFLFLNTIKLIRILKKTQPDIVHINNGGYPGANSARAMVMAARTCGIKLVIMCVNNETVPYSNVGRKFQKLSDKLIVKNINKFITGSKAAQTSLESNLGINKKRCEIINNGVTFADTAPTVPGHLEGSEKFIIGCIGILEERKGHKILLEAVIELFNEKKLAIENITINIAGEGALRAELQEIIDIAKLNSNIFLLGMINNVPKFIDEIDFLVHPSIFYEDFPFAIIEAFSRGKPVVGSRVAGIPEQITPEFDGILVEPRSIEQLKSAIVSMCDPLKIAEYQRNAYFSYKSKFTSEQAINKYLSLYEELLNCR